MLLSYARRSAVAMAVVVLVAACAAPPARPDATDASPSGGAGAGDAANGKLLFASKGCIACHIAPGVSGAFGTIGPNLTGFAARPRIAEVVPNTPANLRQWLKDPAGVKPGTTMPGLNLSDKESDDLAQFLETLR